MHTLIRPKCSPATGNGLELSGGKFSLKDLAKGVGQAANVAIPLAQAFGVRGADQAAAVNNALQGNGLGKGTQKTALAIAKKGARVADKLIGEFGDEKLKRKKIRGRRSRRSLVVRVPTDTPHLKKVPSMLPRRLLCAKWLVKEV